MSNYTQSQNTQRLPTTRSLSPVYVLSILIALMMAFASLIGLLQPTATYVTEVVVQNFVPNDLVNLIVGIPILLGSMWLTRQGKLVGLLSWPGALLYVVYNYVAYLVAIPPGWVTVLYGALVLFSTVGLILLTLSIDRSELKESLHGKIGEKISGGILLFFGIVFLLRAQGLLSEAVDTASTVSTAEIAVLVADIVLSVLWITGGLLLLRESALGYVMGLGLLFAAISLFIGLIVFLLLQPILTEAPFILTDILVVLGMSLLCVVPFAFYVRGVLAAEIST